MVHINCFFVKIQMTQHLFVKAHNGYSNENPRETQLRILATVRS